MSNKGNTFRQAGNSVSGKRALSKESATFKKEKSQKPSIPRDYSDAQQKTVKILGILLILLSLAFATAFVSYLFTWEDDQSYIAKTNGGWSTLFSSSEEIHDEAVELPVVDNKLGKFGALLANQFMYEWFGVASFLFIPVLFILGYRLLFKKSLLPLYRTVVYSFVAIVFISVTLGFLHGFMADTPHMLEGKFGFWTNKLLEAQVGVVGVGCILAFAYLTTLILLYNLDFKFVLFSNRKSKSLSEDLEDEDEEDSYSTNSLRTKVHVEDDSIQSVRESFQRPTSINERFQSNREKNLQEELERPAFTHHPIPEAQIDPKDKVVLTFDDSPLERTEHTPSISFTIDQPEDDNEDEEDTLHLQANSSPSISIAAPAEPEPPLEVAVIPGLVVEDIKEEKEITASDLVAQFGQYDPKLDLSGYQHPTLDLLRDYGTGKITINQHELEANKNKIVDTLRNYSIEIESIKATIGPTVTLYEIIPKPGVRISKIKNLEDDIALSLAALGIRIIAPMPGKGTIGIEVPNSSPEMVSMRSVLATEKFQKTDMDLPIALGKTISNEVYIADLAKMPHLLVAGATGQGKSVGINAILTSLLYKKHPAELKFVLVDPKKVELSLFKKVERHFLAKLPDEEEAIITDTKKVINTLNSLCIEMDQRYDLLKNAQVRNLKEYNAKFINRRLNPEEGHRFLPYIVLIVDEFADLMMTAGKEVETPIARLAQLARAVGIHLVIATQRPSVNIITGTIKANFPARLAFRVLSKVDSRTILDTGGADQLIGRGDMLLATGSDLIRIQCAFVDTPEVEQISDYIGAQRGYPSAFMLPEYVDENGEGSGSVDFDPKDRDQLFEEAARLIVMHQQGSTSLIQRKLKLGYNRAGRIIDQLEAAGIVGPFEGSKAREVLYPDEYSLEQYLETLRNN
ncbi:MAG: cell division protein FtsK [Sphingobacterium sp.]|jgi:S-DNA-T family DNA segregation ATPase FtsK/SpoIIIE|uniref:FtsK/SpoIIIE family DNA translocase n=1 Tax=unclassified Sphingobacterium TaxID=2609468 RepID=UPI0009849316|nr:DNA translocase FtsK [Sphingobacterium sp. CZ-UAM]MDF2518629.1 cell division protein FtsK [Sphingobacterium sp.]OOG17288.1 cell division protein FtsK [Sphingobacterium sp. CZ-UAM]